MTLIVGTVFKDGIVVGGDTLHTETVVGHPLYDYGLTSEKVFCLHNKILWGSSGGGGLGQSAKQDVEQWMAANTALLDRPGDDICPRLAKIIMDSVKKAFNESPFKDHPDMAPAGLKNHFLLAGRPNASPPWLLEVSWANERTRYEEKGFHAIGSAKVYAYAAFGMIRHYGLKDRDRQAALTATYRILDYAVKSAAAGVREPYTIWILDSNGARLLPVPEVNSLRETVGLWLDREAESLTPLPPAPAVAVESQAASATPKTKSP